MTAGELDRSETRPPPKREKSNNTKRFSKITLGEIRFVNAILLEKMTYIDAYLEHVAESKDTQKSTASNAASVVLRRPRVREYWRELQESAKAEARITIPRIIAGVVAIATADRLKAFNNDGTLKPLDEWPRDLRMAVDAIKLDVTETTVGDTTIVRKNIHIKPGGAKLKALELLMRLNKLIGDGAAAAGYSDPDAGKLIVIVEPDREPPAPE